MTEFELRRAEANQFLEELGRLLLRETTEEPDEADLVGKAKPVMRAPALAGLHEIFLVRLAARLSWSRENITGVRLTQKSPITLERMMSSFSQIPEAGYPVDCRIGVHPGRRPLHESGVDRTLF